MNGAKRYGTITPRCVFAEAGLVILNNGFKEDPYIPVIPHGSGLWGMRVLYRLKLKGQANTLAGDVRKPIRNRAMWLELDPSDGYTVRPSKGVTDGNGECTFTIERRTTGGDTTTAALYCAHDQFPDSATGIELDLEFREAWFEGEFYLTCYYIPVDEEFKGPRVTQPNLKESHHAAWYIPVQRNGTGQFQGSDGSTKYVGHPGQYEYRDRPETKAGTWVTAGRSVAVDTKVIPLGAHLDIDGFGPRRAEDIGGKINKDHIDIYVGVGDANLKSWKGNQNRLVKWLGIVDEHMEDDAPE